MQGRSLGRIYVTGADGFIGSHLVEALIAKGHDVSALCVYNSNGNFGWLEGSEARKSQRLKTLLGDVRDPYYVDHTIQGHDTVFHLAALIAIPYSYVAPHSYIETNISGTLNVLEACRKHGVGRLIQTSTSEVYGSALQVPISETHPLQGQSPYSASKIGADALVASYVRSFSLPASILRPFNTYGPRQSLRAVIPTVISQILSGERQILLGSTTPTRDFNFVSDTVNAFVALGQAGDEVIGQTYNAGSGREISIGDFVKLAAATLKAEVEVVCKAERLRPVLSEVERLLADSSKLARTTGWQSSVTLEAGIEQVASWIKNSNLGKNGHVYHV